MTADKTSSPHILNGLAPEYFQQHIQRYAKLEVEIGCGKGKFLIERAAQEPTTLFIGIDWSWKWMKLGLERAEKRCLSNIYFYHGEATAFFENFIKNEQVTVLHLYFPDPWPKKRHHKRRFFQAENLPLVHNLLKPNGLFLVATDHLAYYEAMQDAIAQSHVPWAKIRHTGQREYFAEQKTNYEVKYTEEGRMLSYISFIK